MSKAILIFFLLLNIFCAQAQSPVTNKFATTANEIGLDFWTPLKYDEGFNAFYKRILPEYHGKKNNWRLALRIGGGYRNNSKTGYSVIPRGNGTSYIDIDTFVAKTVTIFGGLSGQWQWKRLIWYAGCDLVYQKATHDKKFIEFQSPSGNNYPIRTNITKEKYNGLGFAFFTGLDVKITRNISVGSELNTSVLLSNWQSRFNGGRTNNYYELDPEFWMPRIIYLGVHF